MIVFGFLGNARVSEDRSLRQNKFLSDCGEDEASPGLFGCKHAISGIDSASS